MTLKVVPGAGLRAPGADGGSAATDLVSVPLRSTAGHIPRATAPMPVVAPQASETPWIGPKGEVMRRLELHLTYHCPERCVFCSEEHRMAAFQRFEVTWGRVAKVLRLHASRGVNAVHFTGGEPTIHPRFVDVCKLAKKLGMRTSVGTIGTMLAREPFAEAALPWLDEALFSLHGPDAATNDRMTRRKGSFDQTVRAIQLARRIRPDFRVYVNTVATQLNVEALPRTVALADALGAELIIVSNTTPEGGGQDHFDTLGLPLETLARVMPQVPERAKRAIVRFFGMPMCLLEPYAALSNDVHWDPRVTVEWARTDDGVAFTSFYNWSPDRRRERVAECQGCARSAICMGVYDTYAERYDTSVLKPYAKSAAGEPASDRSPFPLV